MSSFIHGDKTGRKMFQLNGNIKMIYMENIVNFNNFQPVFIETKPE